MMKRLEKTKGKEAKPGRTNAVISSGISTKRPGVTTRRTDQVTSGSSSKRQRKGDFLSAVLSMLLAFVMIFTSVFPIATQQAYADDLTNTVPKTSDGYETIDGNSFYSNEIYTGFVPNNYTTEAVYGPDYGPYTVPGVLQSQSTTSATSFAAGLPLGTIFIDQSKITQSGGTYKIVSDNTAIIAGLGRAEMTDGGLTMGYDGTKPGAIPMLPGKINHLDGDLFTVTYSDAAVLPNGERADFVITYSNAQIVIDQRYFAAPDGTKYYKFTDWVVPTYERRTTNGKAPSGWSATTETFEELPVYVDAAGNKYVEKIDPDNNKIHYYHMILGIGSDALDLDPSTLTDSGRTYDYYGESCPIYTDTAGNEYIKPGNHQYYHGSVGLAQGNSIRRTGTDKTSFRNAHYVLQSRAIVDDTISSEFGNSYYDVNNGNPVDGSGNAYPITGTTLDVTYKVVNKDGTPAAGTFVFGICGVNLDRDPDTGSANNLGKPLWYSYTDDFGGENGKDHSFFSEAVEILRGQVSDYVYVRPNSDVKDNPEWRDVNGQPIPYPKGEFFWPNVSLHDGNIKFIGNQFNTLSLGGNDNSYSAGFVTLANAATGFTMRSSGHGGAGGGMNSIVFNSKQIWYRYTESTGKHGSIAVTSEGNSGGTLSDGTVYKPEGTWDNGDEWDGSGTPSGIGEAATHVVAEGKTVTYTMTPDIGYKISKLWIGDTWDDVSQSPTHYTEVRFGSDATSNGDAIAAMKKGDTQEITTAAGNKGLLTYKEDGTYTLTFEYAEHHEAVHVEWEPTTSDILVAKVWADKDDKDGLRAAAYADPATTPKFRLEMSLNRGGTWTPVTKNDFAGVTIHPVRTYGDEDIPDGKDSAGKYKDGTYPLNNDATGNHPYTWEYLPVYTYDSNGVADKLIQYRIVELPDPAIEDYENAQYFDSQSFELTSSKTQSVDGWLILEDSTTHKRYIKKGDGQYYEVDANGYASDTPATTQPNSANGITSNEYYTVDKGIPYFAVQAKNEHKPYEIYLEFTKQWDDETIYNMTATDSNAYARQELTFVLHGEITTDNGTETVDLNPNDASTYDITITLSTTEADERDQAIADGGDHTYKIDNYNFGALIEKLPSHEAGKPIAYTLTEKIGGKTVNTTTDLAWTTTGGQLSPVNDSNNKLEGYTTKFVNTPVMDETHARLPVTIDKRDKLTNETLPGATFTVYTDFVNEVKAEETSGNTVGAVDENVVVTDANGAATINFNKEGIYYVVETSAPAGYNKDTTIYQFTVDEKLKSVTLKSADNDHATSWWEAIYEMLFGTGTTDKTNWAPSTDGKGGTLTVQDDPIRANILINKVWDDNNNQDGLRTSGTLPQVKLQKTATPADESSWADVTTVPAPAKTIPAVDAPIIVDQDNYYTWADLPAYENGQLLYYRVVEFGGTVKNNAPFLPTGDHPEETAYAYTAKTANGNEEKFNIATITDPDNPTSRNRTVTVTNKHIPGKVKLSVSKDWADDTGVENQRRAANLTLYKTVNGAESVVDTNVTVPIENSSNPKFHTWDNLPAFENGYPVTYRVEEAPINQYATTYTTAYTKTDNSSGNGAGNSVTASDIKRTWDATRNETTEATIAIRNANLRNLTVKKTWINGANSNVTYKLYCTISADPAVIDWDQAKGAGTPSQLDPSRTVYNWTPDPTIWEEVPGITVDFAAGRFATSPTGASVEEIIEGLPKADAQGRTYTYRVWEDVDTSRYEANQVSNTEVQNVNIHATNGIANVNVVKELQGRDWTKSTNFTDRFYFKIEPYEDDGSIYNNAGAYGYDAQGNKITDPTTVPMPKASGTVRAVTDVDKDDVQVGAIGRNVDFDPIEYTVTQVDMGQTAEYYYKVYEVYDAAGRSLDEATEHTGKKDGITYAGAVDNGTFKPVEHTLKIVVSSDSTGKITTALFWDRNTTQSAVPVYTNTYDASAEVHAHIIKQVEGREITGSDTFNFTITNMAGAPMRSTEDGAANTATLSHNAGSITASSGSKVQTGTDGFDPVSGNGGNYRAIQSASSTWIKVADLAQRTADGKATDTFIYRLGENASDAANNPSTAAAGDLTFDKRYIYVKVVATDNLDGTININKTYWYDGTCNSEPVDTKVLVSKADGSIAPAGSTAGADYVYEPAAIFTNTQTIDIPVIKEWVGDPAVEDVTLNLKRKLIPLSAEPGLTYAGAESASSYNNEGWKDVGNVKIAPRGDFVTGSTPNYDNGTDGPASKLYKDVDGFNKDLPKYVTMDGVTYRAVYKLEEPDTSDAYDISYRSEKGGTRTENNQIFLDGETLVVTNTVTATNQANIAAVKQLLGRQWLGTDDFSFTLEPAGKGKYKADGSFNGIDDTDDAKAAVPMPATDATRDSKTTGEGKDTIATTHAKKGNGTNFPVVDPNGNLERLARFGEITFNLNDLTWVKDHYEGDFFYIMKEKHEDATQNSDGTYTKDGITYDTDSHTVHVKVTSNRTNQLYVQIAYDESTVGDASTGTQFTPVYTNRYDAVGTQDAQIDKYIMGRDFKEGETFTFKITPLGDTPMVDAGTGERLDSRDGTITVLDATKTVQTLTLPNIKFILDDLPWTVGANGAVDARDGTAGPLTYSDGTTTPVAGMKYGRFMYAFKETSASAEDLTLDADTEYVQVTVIDKGDGTLDTQVKYFEDRYGTKPRYTPNEDGTPSTTPATAAAFVNKLKRDLDVTKVWTNPATSDVTLRLQWSTDGTNWTNADGTSWLAGVTTTHTIPKGAEVDDLTVHFKDLPAYMPDNNAIIDLDDTWVYYRVVEDAVADTDTRYSTTEIPTTAKLSDYATGHTEDDVYTEAEDASDSIDHIWVGNFPIDREGTASVHVVKQLIGRGWTDADSFTFQIAPKESRKGNESAAVPYDANDTERTFPMPAGANGPTDTATATTRSTPVTVGEYNATFDNITIKLSDLEVDPDDNVAKGWFTYTITEPKPANATEVVDTSTNPATTYWVKDNVKYTTETHEVTIYAQNDGNGVVATTVSYDGRPAGDFVPVYTNEAIVPTPIEGSKTWVGGEASEHINANGEGVDARGITLWRKTSADTDWTPLGRDDADRKLVVVWDNATGNSDYTVMAKKVTTDPDTGDETTENVNPVLDMMDNDGYKYEYRISEGSVPDDYAVTYATRTITNDTITNTSTKTVSLTVTKNWNDDDLQDSADKGYDRPESVAVKLTANKGGATYANVALSDDNLWTHTWSGLPRYAAVTGEGGVVTYEPITYTITEIVGDAPQGYDVTYKLNGTATANEGKTAPQVNASTLGAPENYTAEVEVTNTPNVADKVEADLVLHKIDSVTGKNIAGVQFELKQGDTVKRTYTTDANGVAHINFAEAFATTGGTYTYTLTEKAQATGYNANDNTYQITVKTDNTGKALVEKVELKAPGKNIFEQLFDLIVGGNSPDYDATNRILTVKNTPKTNNVTVSKTFVDSDGNAIPAALLGNFEIKANYTGVKNDGTADPQAKTLKVTGGDITPTASTDGKTYTWEITGVAYGTDVHVHETKYIKLTGYDFQSTVATASASGAQTHDDDASFMMPNEATTVGFTNTYTKQTGDLELVKNWSDDSNRDGARPQNVSFTVTASAPVFGTAAEPSTTKTVTLTGEETAGSWSNTSLTDLPLYHEGEKVTYTVNEATVPEGYSKAIDQNAGVALTKDATKTLSITNSYTPKVDSLTVMKKWEDNNDAAGLRPDSVVFHLYKTVNDTDVSAGVTPKTVSSTGVNFATWTNLPVYENGKKITYKVVEEAVPGYSTTYDAAQTIELDGNTTAEVQVITVTNELAPETTEVKVTKNWNDSNNVDGLRAEATVTLYESVYNEGTKKYGRPAATTQTATLAVTDNATATFSDLPSIKNGKPVMYSVVETTIPTGYTAVVTGNQVDGYTVTNTHVPTTTTATVTKSWSDNNNDYGTRPDAVTMHLYKKVGADGTLTDTGKFVTLSAADSWTHTMDGLPTHELVNTAAAGEDPAYESQEVTYFWKEDVPKGYMASSENYMAGSTEYVTNGGTITNTAILDDLKVAKVWFDDNDAAGLRPDSVQFHLYKADGKSAGVDAKTVNLAGTWMTTWENLPVYDKNGNKISYKVVEEAVPGYTTTYDAAQTIELDGDKTVEQKVTVENRLAREVTSVTVTKNWNDNNNQDGLRAPATVTLYESVYNETSKKYDCPVDMSLTRTLAETDGSEAKFDNLPAIKNGKPVMYSVVETTVPTGYTAAVTGNQADGFTITNTHVPAKGCVEVQKIWDDNNNQDGKRANVTFTLKANGAAATYADGTAVSTKTISADINKPQSAAWHNLPVYKNGEKITYTVEETRITGYNEPTYSAGVKLDGDGDTKTLTVTNKHTPETTTLTVTKKWNDRRNQDGMRADVTLHLKGTIAGSDFTLTFDDKTIAKDATAADNAAAGTATWTGLPVYHNGEKITYSVSEEAVPGYSVSGGTITTDATTGEMTAELLNTRTPAVTSVKVTKVWDDGNNVDDLRKDVTVRLLADGNSAVNSEGIDIGEVILAQGTNHDEQMEATWTNLPAYKGGQPIVYTVSEEAIDGYTPQITGDAANGFTITNTHVPNIRTISVTKVWDDAALLGTANYNRPKDVSVNLFANGTAVGEARGLSEDNSWATSWTVPVNDANGAIEYIVKELNTPTGYIYSGDVTVTGTGDQYVTITNTAKPSEVENPLEITVKKTNLKGDLLEGATFNFKDPDGNEVNVTSDADGRFTLTFPKDGSYTLKETSAPTGYELDSIPITLKVSKQLSEINLHTGDDVWANIYNLFIDSTPRGWDEASKTLTLPNEPKLFEMSLRKNYGGIADLPDGFTITVTYTDQYGIEQTITRTKDNISSYRRGEWANFNLTGKVIPYGSTVTVTESGYEVAGKAVASTSFGRFLKLNDPIIVPVDGNFGSTTATFTMPDIPNEYYAVQVAFTNTYVDDTNVTIPVAKVWDDANDQDGKRPNEVTFRLFANGVDTGKTVTLSVADVDDTNANRWAKADAFTVPTTDETDTPIKYTVREDVSRELVENGYTGETNEGTADNDYTITNRREPDTTGVMITKVWDDASNQDGSRPEASTFAQNVELCADGQPVTGATPSVTDNGDDTYTLSWTGLPKYAEGKQGEEIVYTVAETIVPEGYELTSADPVATGETITNRHVPETTEVNVTKVWDDEGDYDGLRPSNIIVTLLQNGTTYSPAGFTNPVVLSEDNNWTYTFTDLPRKDINGEPYVYKVTEGTAPTGYTPSYLSENAPDDDLTDGTVGSSCEVTITNKHVVEREDDVVATKVWDDGTAGNKDMHTDVVLHLYGTNSNGRILYDAGIKKIEMDTDGQPKGEARWTDLPSYHYGDEELEWMIVEEAVPGYSSKVVEVSPNTFEVTNTYDGPTTKVSVEKDWQDNENVDKKRPTSVSYQLWKKVGDKAAEMVGSAVEAVETPASPATDATGQLADWGYQWTNLPTTEEVKSATPETVDRLKVEIRYRNIHDDTNISAAEYDALTDAGPTTRDYEQVMDVVDPPRWIDAGGNEIGQDEFELLPQDEKDKCAPLTTPRVPAEYRNINDGTTIGQDEYDNLQEQSKADYEPYESETTETEQVDVYETKPVIYWVEEVYTGTDLETNGYEEPVIESLGGGQYKAINTRQRGTMNLVVTKIWADDNNKSGMRPDHITVILKADGDEVRREIVTGDMEASEWTCTFENLPKNGAYGAIEYTVDELEVPGYSKALADGGFVITNTHNMNPVHLEVTKVWKDANGNELPSQDKAVELRLIRVMDGSEKDMGDDNKKLIPAGASGDALTVRWENLDSEVDGKSVTYTVREVPIDGYTVSYPDGVVANGNILKVTVVNTKAPDPEMITITYVDSDEFGGEVVKTVTIQKGDNEPAQPADPTHDGYIFTGWQREVDADGNVTYKARYHKIPEPGMISVTYEYVGEDGNNVINTEDINRGDNEPESPTVPEREGFIFKGWKRTMDENGNVKYVAQYVELVDIITPVKVTYVDPKASDGNMVLKAKRYNTSAEAEDAAENTMERPENPSHPDYDFVGWVANQDEFGDWILVAKYNEKLPETENKKTTSYIDPVSGKLLKSEVTDNPSSVEPPTPTTYESMQFVEWAEIVDANGNTVFVAKYAVDCKNGSSAPPAEPKPSPEPTPAPNPAPNTGDDSMPIKWIVIGTVAGLGIMTSRRRRAS